MVIHTQAEAHHMQQMKQIETDNKPAGVHAWFAARDAAFRSAVNSSHFQNAVKIKAERVKLVLEMLYYSDTVSITYNKSSVRVKVHNARPRDKKLIAEWDSTWAQDGILVKKSTAQGIIYLIPRV
jgi:hypothetical protein